MNPDIEELSAFEKSVDRAGSTEKLDHVPIADVFNISMADCRGNTSVDKNDRLSC